MRPKKPNPNQRELPFGRARAPEFDGADYQPARDKARLNDQLERVFSCMRGGEWRTLSQIAEVTGDPTPSISAQLRHLRKPRFGAHTVEKRYVGQGLYEYRLIVNRGAL